MLNTSINSTPGAFTSLFCLEKKHFGSIMCHIGMFFCGLLGTPAFLWLFWLFLRLHAGRKFKPTHVFHVNIIVMDLLFCMHINISFIVTCVFQNATASHVANFLFGLTWLCRPLIQTCFCFELYLAVLYPVTFLRYKSALYRIAPAAVAWLMASGYGIFLIFSSIPFPDYIFISVFITGLTTISFICVSLLCALKHPGPANKQISKDTQRDVRNQQKQNAFRTISSMLFTVIFCYLPMVSLCIFTVIHIDRELLDCDIAPLMSTFTYFSVLKSLFVRLYKRGHLKCINKQGR